MNIYLVYDAKETCKKETWWIPSFSFLLRINICTNILWQYIAVFSSHWLTLESFCLPSFEILFSCFIRIDSCSFLQRVQWLWYAYSTSQGASQLEKVHEKSFNSDWKRVTTKMYKWIISIEPNDLDY